MPGSLSVRTKMLVSVAGILIGAILVTSLISAHLFRAALTERLEQYELVRTVEAIRNNLDKSVSTPMAQTVMMANNTFLLDWMGAGEPASGIAAWQTYAKKIKEATGAAMVSWISEHTLNYYDDAKGLSRKVDPNGADPWFKAFMQGGKNQIFNLGIEPDKPNITMMFVNVMAKDSAGHRAIASLGLDVSDIVSMIRQTTIGKTGQVFVVDTQGKIQIHRDPAMVKIDNKVDLRSLPGMADVAPTLLTRSTFNLGHYHGPNGPMVVASSYMPNADWMVIVEIAENEVYAAVNQTFLWLAIISVLVLALSLLLMWNVATSITRPLGQLNHAMKSLTSGHGDLTLRLPVDSRDETGEIARSFNMFMDQLHQKFVSVQTQTHKLNGSVNELGDMTHHLTQNSRDNTDLAESTAATIEEITVSINHIASNTQNTTLAVEQASNLSSNSAQSMSRVSSEISRVAQSMGALMPVMTDLGERSRQIGSIANVIKEIADQTNLLALNASIEAARAGEQGRGFAVVADEVRKLAERTGQATVEIDQMVSAMRQASEQAIGRVEQTNESVNSGVRMIDDTLQIITDIQASMQNVISKTTEIRDAASEQSHATETMAKAAEQMSQRAQDENTQIRNTELITENLARLSDDLNKVVSSFKL